jgi:hypothetical protein
MRHTRQYDRKLAAIADTPRKKINFFMNGIETDDDV